MNNLNLEPSLQPNKQLNWPVLFLRWLLGALAAIGISSLIYLDFLTGINIIPILLKLPFVGQYYILNYLIYSGLNSSKYSIIIPALIWGVIGALLTSGNKKQIHSGRTLLILYVIGGIGSYFLAVLLFVIT
jgi:hypothetical protein